MSRSWLLLSLALLALPATAANLRYAEDQAPAIVNPLFGSTMAEARVNELLFEGLYTDNQDLATTPALASTAELSPDKTEMTIRLRDDVTWQDGKPLSAADVVFTNPGGHFLSAGELPLPAIYGAFAAAFAGALLVWLRYTRAHAGSAHTLHHLMSALVGLKALSLACEALVLRDAEREGT
jgi:hypothetical protein